MPETAQPAFDSPTPEPLVDRRRLLRRGAAVAGVAGASVVGAAVSASPAAAADGDPVLLGAGNNSSSATTVRIGGTAGSPGNPALALQNASGPSLALAPVGGAFSGALDVGEIANTEAGPYLGVDYGGGAEVTYLVTAVDLANAFQSLPQTVAIPPVRLMDTRSPAGREGILTSSGGAFDSAGRLRAGAYMDVAVDSADTDLTVESAFLNILVLSSPTGGFLTAYPPGNRPGTSTLNYTAGQTLANGTFVALGVVTTAAGAFFAVRIYVSGTTHVVIDLTGGVTVDAAPQPAAAQRKSAALPSAGTRLRRTRATLGR